MDQETKNLIESFGLEEIASKNPVMTSFKNDEVRINYYFTTGKLSIQGEGRNDY